MSTNEMTLGAINDDTLRAIETFEDAFQAVKDSGAVAEKVSDYGTGFEILASGDKDKLVGVPFIILSSTFHEGDYSDDFVSCEIVTKHNEKYILNDGGKGIAAQIFSIVKERAEKGIANPGAGIYAENGLTRSDYFRNKDTDEKRTRIPEGANAKDWEPAVTFYLA